MSGKRLVESVTIMTTETSMDVGFLEKLGDFFNNFSEGAGTFITRLFGSSNERTIRSLGYVASRDPSVPPTIIEGSLLAQVNELEPQMQPLSDDELKGMTAKL